MGGASSPPRLRLALLYALSGAAALVIETVWLRWLHLLLGATAPAASATLVAFFSGQALGAAWAGRRAAGWHRPIAMYGRLELLAALAALAVPVLLRALGIPLAAAYDTIRDETVLLTSARYAVALLATLPAAFCFGATFPAMGAAVVGGASRLGSLGSVLYGLNTLGAACGTAVAAFVLIEGLGVRSTYLVGIGLSVCAGVGALLLARGAEPSSDAAHARRVVPPSVEARPAASPPRGVPRLAVCLALVSGFGALAAQVLLVHAFSLVFNQSVHAFAAVLVVVLVALAAGAGLVALVLVRFEVDSRTFAALALVIAAAGLATYPAWFFHVTDGLLAVRSAEPGLAYAARVLLLAAVTAGPLLLAAALLLPLSFAIAGAGQGSGRESPAGSTLGRLIAWNMLGAIAGALAAPYLLLPMLGLWSAFGLLGALYAVVAALLPDATPRRRSLRIGLLLAGAAVVVAFANPGSVPPLRLRPGESLLAIDSTPSGVVAVVERGDRLVLKTDNFTLGGSGTGAERRQGRQGHVPLLLHPEARSAVFVGSATGGTAGAATAHPLERITLVEIVPAVSRAARRFFAPVNRGVYDDPRTRVVIDDARNFLASTRERFDVVVGDLFHPWRGGTGSLYAREHFDNVRARLSQGGLFCQWLPLYQLGESELRIIAATFVDVFPRAALFRADFQSRSPVVALVGWNGEPAHPERISSSSARLATAGVEDGWISDALGVWTLYVGPASAIAELSEAERNTDDRPRIEFLAARGSRGGGVDRERMLAGAAWLHFSQTLRENARRSGDDVYPHLAPQALRAVEAGAALEEAQLLETTGRNEAAAARRAEALSLLPPRLARLADGDA